jgi:hypothetical protein
LVSRCALARSLLPTNSLVGVGGVLRARRTPASIRWAISSSLSSLSDTLIIAPFPFGLERMINNDSYLARPPAIINPRQRLCLEAISFSIKSIATDIQKIRSIASTHSVIPPDVTDFSPHDKISLCGSLWSVVDQTHMLNNILKELNLSAPYIDSFISKYAAARSMRNCMDHIHGQINNFIDSKKSRPTVFGCLSYFVFDNAWRNESGQHYGLIVIVHFGNLTDKKQNFPVVNPAGRRFVSGASLFQFSAFEYTLLIDDLYYDVQQLANNIEFTLIDGVNREVNKLKEQGIDTTGPLAQPVSFIATMRFNFDDPTSAESEAPLAGHPETP